jgi:hypothetical protein
MKMKKFLCLMMVLFGILFSSFANDASAQKIYTENGYFEPYDSTFRVTDEIAPNMWQGDVRIYMWTNHDGGYLNRDFFLTFRVNTTTGEMWYGLQDQKTGEFEGWGKINFSTVYTNGLQNRIYRYILYSFYNARPDLISKSMVDYYSINGPSKR